MGLRRKLNSYSRRTWIVALFLCAAFLLGGGEAKGPASEMFLQFAFAVAAILWLWAPSANPLPRSADARIVLFLLLLIAAIPVIQLVPLPPSVWRSLPGREGEIAALQLVGAANSWRPVSAVPLRTLGSLLAMIPALGVFAAVTRLDIRERRMILRAVLVLAFLTALVGGLQVAAGNGSLNFYSKIHAGWVTGFQSNRNHAAEVLLAGLLALAVLVRLSLLGRSAVASDPVRARHTRIVEIGLALLLTTALIMTGSRSGIALGLPAAATAVAILLFPTGEGRRFPFHVFVVSCAVLAAILTVGAILLSDDKTSVARVAARFADFDTQRSKVWADAVFALRQYWPVGIGAGGFIAAMFPAERLEFVDPTFPNQAHNDYLEIGMEAGLAGYVVLALVFACLAYIAFRNWIGDRSAESRLQLIFGATVLILLSLHSIVDYPLRSMALASLAGAASGMLTRTGRHASQAQTRATDG